MKCPFDPDYVTTWTRHGPKYHPLNVEDADGTPDRLHLYNNDETALTVHRLRDCLGGDCAAWDHGAARCRRT